MRPTLIWDQRYLLRALREFEAFYNHHRPHQDIANARPLRPLPPPITDPDQIARLDIGRHAWLGGSSTSTIMPPELHGCDYRQEQPSARILSRQD